MVKSMKWLAAGALCLAAAGAQAQVNQVRVWAAAWADKIPTEAALYLQPEWDKASIVTPLIIEYIKSHPKWELSLQVHKYINVP